jgi:hypothetical protein
MSMCLKNRTLDATTGNYRANRKIFFSRLFELECRVSAATREPVSGCSGAGSRLVRACRVETGIAPSARQPSVQGSDKVKRQKPLTPGKLLGLGKES